MKHQKTALIALSGGVDSAVSAYILKKQGFRVVGLFMQTFRDETNAKNPCKSISSLTDERMAKIIAKILKIKLIIKNCKSEYSKKVIKSMVKDYAKGLTPNPDIECNKLIKFHHSPRDRTQGYRFSDFGGGISRSTYHPDHPVTAGFCRAW